MLERFYPGEYVDSTYAIDFDRLYEEDIEALFFDIDNTLKGAARRAGRRAKRSISDYK